MREDQEYKEARTEFWTPNSRGLRAPPARGNPLALPNIQHRTCSSVPSTVGDRFYKFSALRTTASAVCQNCREHTQSVLAEVPSEITSHGRKIGPHHQCKVWSTLRLGACDGLEPVKRHFCVVEPKDRPIPPLLPGLYACRSRSAGSLPRHRAPKGPDT